MGKKVKKTRGKSKLQVVTLCVSTSMVLILLGLVVFTVFTARNLSNHVKQNLTVRMTLANEVTDPEGEMFSQQLQTRPYIAELEYFSRDSVLAGLREELGTDPAEFVGENPFAAEIDFQLQADYANTDSLKWISQELRQNAQIAEVEFPENLIDSVNSALKKVGIVLLVLAALLLFISFTLINNTIQLSVFARRFNIHTMKLVGASWSFIRWPFIRKAVGLGLLSGIIAVIVLGAGVYFLFQYEPDVYRVITWQVMLFTAIAVIVLGVLITTVCSWLSVNKFLRMKAGELYRF